MPDADPTFADFIRQVLVGLPQTLQLAGLSLAIGLPLGLILAVARSQPNLALKILCRLIIEVGRGMPVLVLLYLIYQGAPEYQIRLSAAQTAVAAFSLATAAYSAEIFRGGLSAVPRGQWEAARNDGLRPVATMVHVVLPQAARISVPPLLGLSIQVFQFTSLAYAITIPEVMQQAYIVGSLTFRYLDAYLAAAVVYASIALSASWLVSRLDRRLSRHLQTR